MADRHKPRRSAKQGSAPSRAVAPAPASPTNSGTQPVHAQPQRLSFPAGAIIFSEGDPGDCAYLIHTGRVEITVARNRRKLVLATLERGDLFGELSLINDAPRSAAAHATDDTELVAIGRDTFRDKLATTDPLVALFMRAVLERFHEARERLLSLAAPGNSWNTSTMAHDREFRSNRRASIREINFRGELEDALRNGQFQLHLQPIVALRGQRLEGFEALIRWHHPSRGLVGPNRFIEFAEGTGQILALGAWVFEEVCRLQSMLPIQAGGPAPFISVNLSTRQISEPHLAERIARTAERWQASPNHIKLEITESALMDNPQQATLVLVDLRRRGFTLAIDDFGTGYSSFNYLARFPLDSLKIDKSFVEGVTTDPKSATIIRSLTALAHALDMKVIAEGVETDAQVAALQDLGCDLGQGHYYSKPLPFDEARRWVGP